MAKHDEETPMVNVNDLAAAMANAINGLKPKPEMREGDPEWNAMLKEEGLLDDFFGVTVLQNAYEAQARGLSEETRRRASQLKPGTYIKGRVRVSVEHNGQIVRLMYPVSGDNRMINMQYFSSFEDLVNKIWNEMHAPVAAA